MPFISTQLARTENGGLSSPKPASQQTDHDLLSCLLDYIPDRIYYKDKDGRFTLVSRAEGEYLGTSDPAAVIGKTDFDYFAPALAQAAYDDEQRVMSTGEPITGKVEEKVLLDGRTGWALVAKIPLRDADGRIIGTCGISKDITELKAAEEALQAANTSLAARQTQLEQSLAELNMTHEELKSAQQRLIDFEKIQWIARLAFGVAHEIRNPLSTVEMGLDYLSKKPEVTQDKKTADILGMMVEAMNRADVVITALMDGAKSSSVSVQTTEISEIVRLAVNMMKSS